jgi:predicted metal-dependent phosphoesterase TrpH
MSYLFKKNNRIKYADLHLHTDQSDGKLNPENIVKEANRAGLSTIAITDHDMLDGIKPALLAGKQYGIEVIPGLELSAESDGEEIHILGFFIDWEKKQLQERLIELRELRYDRALMMMDKLRKMGVIIELSDILDQTETSYIGRPHLAAALVKNGYADSISEAFQRFLGNHAPAYIPKDAFSPSEAIEVILNAFGIPVLAHPGILKQDILDKLIDNGLMGIEAFHSYHSIPLSDYYCSIARERNLLITGGSDFHGFENSRKVLGTVRLPYEYVEDLKSAADEKQIYSNNKTEICKVI